MAELGLIASFGEIATTAEGFLVFGPMRGMSAITGVSLALWNPAADPSGTDLEVYVGASVLAYDPGGTPGAAQFQAGQTWIGSAELAFASGDRLPMVRLDARQNGSSLERLPAFPLPVPLDGQTFVMVALANRSGQNIAGTAAVLGRFRSV